MEKSKGKEKLWDKIKCEDGTYKFDIDSILNEQIKFYEKLFKTEGWDEERGDYLLSSVKETLDDREKTDLEKELNEIEIKNSVMALKPHKSPGEDGIIGCYQLYWDVIKNEFIQLLSEIFTENTLSESQYRGIISLLYKGGERENIKNWRPLTVLNCDYKIIAKILATRLKTITKNYSYRSKWVC